MKNTFFVFMSLLSLNASAANYFIDFAGGSDGNAGTNDSAPFMHCPGDDAATGLAAGVTLQRGDVLIFKGGVVYYASSSNIRAKSDGLTYLSGHKFNNGWPEGTTQRAVIDGTNSNVNYEYSTGIIDLRAYSDMVVDGLEIRNQPTYGPYTGCIGWKGSTGGNVMVRDCVIHYANSQAIVFQGSFSGDRPTGFTISSCTLYDTWGHNIMIRYGIDSVLIEKCRLSRPSVDLYGAGNSGADNICLAEFGNNGMSNITLRDNDINYDSPTPTKGHILISWTPLTGQPLTNFTIERNLFRGAPNVASLLFFSRIDNLVIRNNIFNLKPGGNAQGKGIIRFFNAAPGSFYNGVKIINNTFVATPEYNGIILLAAACTPPSGVTSCGDDEFIFTDVQIRNNIFDCDSDIAPKIFVSIFENYAKTGPCVNMSKFVCNNNVYNTLSDKHKFEFWNNVGKTRETLTFDQWKTATAGDSDSKTGAVSFVDRSSKIFELDPNDTTALHQGINLSSDPVFNDPGYAVDYKGMTRDNASPWSLGAYEYASGVSGAKPPARPRGLRTK